MCDSNHLSVARKQHRTPDHEISDDHVTKHQSQTVIRHARKLIGFLCHCLLRQRYQRAGYENLMQYPMISTIDSPPDFGNTRETDMANKLQSSSICIRDERTMLAAYEVFCLFFFILLFGEECDIMIRPSHGLVSPHSNPLIPRLNILISKINLVLSC